MISQNYRLQNLSNTNFQRTVLNRDGKPLPIPPEKEVAMLGIVEEATDILQHDFSLPGFTAKETSHSFKKGGLSLLLEDNDRQISYFSRERSMVIEKTPTMRKFSQKLLQN